jgi:hypothetical protein
LVNASIEIIVALANGLISALPELLEKAPEIVMNLVEAIIENAPKLLDSAFEIIVKLVEGIVDNLPKIFEAGAEILTTLIDGASQMLGGVFEVGSKIVGQIKAGISAAWDGLVNWFNGIWNSLFGNRSVNVNVNQSSSASVDGSHYSGLDYVPFDGYIAELHRGERVLTAAEAQNYNSGATYGDIIINVNGAKYENGRDLANEIAEVLRDRVVRKERVYA